MGDWLTPFLVFAGVVVTAVVSGSVTYFVARRNTSGNINTSQAAELWAESNKLRAEYKERAEKLESRLEEVNNQLSTVMAQLADLKTNSVLQDGKIEELQRIIKELREENQRLLALKRDVEL
jgi:septal ring factor EnvC (AmiA/AmiB activator)